MNEYLDFLSGPAGTNDPMAVLRKAQEKLREEEMARQTLESLLARTKDLPQEMDERLAAPRENEARKKLMERLAQDTPLDKMAQLSPQDLERQMYERVWGAPAKSKLGKVGKGISDVIGVLGGVPSNFSKPAMEQFLKIQEQYRKDRANDLTAYNQTANAVGREQTAHDKNSVDWNKAVMKTAMDMYRTKDYATFHDNMNKNWQAIRASDDEKNKMKAQEIALKAEEIRNKFANNPQAFAQALQKMPESQRYETMWLYDMVTSLQGANKGAGSGQGTTSVSTTVRREADETGRMQNIPITTTRQSSPAGASNAMQNRAQGIREQLAQKLGMPAPIAPTDVRTPPFVAPLREGATPTAKPSPSEDLSLNTSSDTFRLANGSGPQTYNAAGAEKKKAARTQMIAFNNMVTAIVRGAEDGTLDKVAGGLGKTGPLKLGNQPISQITRFLHEWKLPGKDLGEGANAAWRRSMGTYADDPKAQNLFEDITNNRVDILANKVLEMSGKAATDQERAFLNIPMPHITDDPRILVNQTLRKALRAQAIIRLDDLGLRSNDPNYYKLISEIGNKADNLAINILNEAQKKKINRLASPQSGIKSFSLDDINPDRLIYETLKETNMLQAFPQLRLEQATPTKPTQQLQQKLKGLTREQRKKALGLM